jgi:hypothetical protein
MRATGHGPPNHPRQALSDAQQFLFEERQRLLALQAENDELKLQELEDRKRIQQLLAMTRPLEQQVAYAGGALPAASALPAGAAAAAAQQHAGQQPGVMRTVFLPTANADALLLKIESLQAQLNEQVGQGWASRTQAAAKGPQLQRRRTHSALPRCRAEGAGRGEGGGAAGGPQGPAAGGGAPPRELPRPGGQPAGGSCWRAAH